MNERLQSFREQAYARGFAPQSSPKEEHWTAAFFGLYAARPLAERQARSLAHALLHEPVLIHPLTRLAGQIFQCCPGAGCPELNGSSTHPDWTEYSVAAQARQRVSAALPENEAYARYFGDGAFPGHICWDFGRLLELGVEGMLQQVSDHATTARDPAAAEFYAATTIVLEGLLAWVERHVTALETMATTEADVVRRRELLDMAAVCRRVPRQPATTFRQAVQAFWFQHLAVMYENPFGGNGPGRLDYYLWPYLERDLQAGRTSMEAARELLTELFIKLHERIAPHDGWVEALPVGGRNPDGTLAVTPLSCLVLEVITELKQTHPSVYVRLPEGAPDRFVDLTVRYVLESGNRAQVYGDEAMVEALHRGGVDLPDARHWTAGGCMEVSPQGCNSDLLFSFAHNVARTLELVLNGGHLLQTGEQAFPHLTRTLADYASFEELYAAFETELHRELAILGHRLDLWQECYARYRPSFLLSTMTHDCLERGRSINAGGARYNHYGGSGVGIPNVGDSLAALRQAVFVDQRCSGADMLAALRADFVGHEPLRQYLVSLPRYGADHPPADAMVDRVLGSFIDGLERHQARHGGRIVPVILGFVWVVEYGKQVGATPDGRRAGRPLAHGLSPQSGSAVEGITAAIHSATRLSLHRVAGGGAMMWDLDPGWAARDTVRPLLATFAQQGGHIFQGNVIDTARLLAAQEHPEDHQDLVVRVSGFSARFVSLSRATQDEIIHRHRYGA